ncbi:MAG: hypothetical protein WDZ35_09160 [Crocinitomicaceae bacterium]
MKAQANTYQRDGRAPIPKKESTSKTLVIWECEIKNNLNSYVDRIKFILKE